MNKWSLRFFLVVIFIGIIVGFLYLKSNFEAYKSEEAQKSINEFYGNLWKVNLSHDYFKIQNDLNQLMSRHHSEMTEEQKLRLVNTSDSLKTEFNKIIKK
ncbi:hypothetical protein [Moheibacter sediminis]|uniref:Four helix bundle sensory module for signal transduction n=1 Tax=Moheibacter sediminis TaxID=1434700 RepID=A0A1W1Z5V6_9FLAO|nr:hypothetical protein [Moheibacter sediminis]SMC43682.1 hypothetical protein SAMN06296427_102216 [Moheibacter sediminis]